MAVKSAIHKKASRKTISCENCRARKVRCSRESPCQHCVKRGEECVWKADAHPLVRHTKGHSYVETDSTTLHKAIDVLATRLTMTSDDIDELIRSFSPSGSSSASHSETESLSDNAGSPLLSPVASMSASAQAPPKSISPPSFNYLQTQPPAPLAWPSGTSISQQPSFTMPQSMSSAPASYGGPAAESWGRAPPMSMQDQLVSYPFGAHNNLVLPQATTPSAFPPTMNGFFEPLPLGMPSSAASMQAQPSRESETTFNNWLTAALGPMGSYPLPARTSFLSTPVLA